jgi:hypothetical protein
MPADISNLGRTQASPVTGTMDDFSGTIAVDSLSQVAMPANQARQWLLFQNHSTADMWLSFSGDAVIGQPSINIPAGATWTPGFVDRRALSLISVLAGAPYTLKSA